MAVKRPSRRHPSYMKQAEHHRLWSLIEGAVVDAFRQHPDYLTPKGEGSAVNSITKRVIGQLVGNAKRTREGGRPG